MGRNGLLSRITVARPAATIFIGFLLVTQAVATERVTRVVRYQSQQQQASVTGEVLREFSDGSLLLLSSDGRLHTIQGSEVVENRTENVPLQVASDAEIIDELRTSLGQEFQYLETKQYVIAYNTNAAYAEWVGQLFSRLYRGFHNYWDNRGVKLQEPRFPLVAIVFRNKSSYLAYSQRDIGDSAGSMFGYYNMNSNRMVMYDLTGVDGMVAPGRRVSTQALINQVLSQPEAERTVATIVHEAVHQLSFNTGLQVRLADNPLWLSEGLAMFFESPDLRSPQGWKMGSVNYHNLRLFIQNSGRRQENSIASLIGDDARFKNSETVAEAYPEGWALTYFLMKARSKQFAAFLEAIGELEPLEEPDTEQRIELFIKHFGDLKKLDREFVNYMKRVR